MGLDRSVLVLNASYEPLHICNTKRAVTLVMKGVAVCEEVTDYLLRSPSTSFHSPDVIRLKDYVRVHRKIRSFSRKQVFLRDGFQCQYCTEYFSVNDLTVDHVFPRSRGGKYTWENIVTACKDCNRDKGDRTPEEARMPLLSQPKAPSVLHLHLQSVRQAGLHRHSWKKYLFY